MSTSRFVIRLVSVKDRPVTGLFVAKQGWVKGPYGRDFQFTSGARSPNEAKSWLTQKGAQRNADALNLLDTDYVFAVVDWSE